MVNLLIDKAALFGHVVEQHASDAAFLWMLRAQACDSTDPTAATIEKLEHRINAHLNGLMAASAAAWGYALQAAEFKEGGECFVLAMLAFSSHDQGKIETALAIGTENSETLKGLVSALGWLPEACIYPWLKPWIGGSDGMHQYLAIATCSVRRLDPLHYLDALFNDEQTVKNIPLYSRMLRLAGEIKRHDLLPRLMDAQRSSEPAIAFWGGWSALLLGEQGALAGLEPYVMQPGPWQVAAIDLVFRQKRDTPLWSWLNGLILAPEQIRQAMTAVATHGDPLGMEWLLGRMQLPQYARAAGAAFSTITGVDLLQMSLTAPPPDEPDETAMEGESPIFAEDINLPQPDADKVQQHWQQIGQHFNKGERYLLGRPPQPEWLQHILMRGRQRHRMAAATELALLAPAAAYPNAKATLYQRRGQ